MKHSFFLPAASLAVTALCVLMVLYLTGRMVPVVEPDSGTYLEFDTSSVKSALTQIRTFGYPLFLKAAGSTSRVPVLQWLVHSAACGMFFFGLTAVGYRVWVAFASAATLLLSRAVFEWVHHITADSLAVALAIASAGSLLVVLGKRKSAPGWAALTALTFLTYQVRPAYLFLIPLWPVVGLWLDTFVLRRDATLRTNLLRTCRYAMVTIVPFLLFCTLRLLVVGHWGLVSFGGYNVVGIAAQFLDAPTVAELPDKLQPLAAKIVEGRAAIEGSQPPESYEAMETMFNPTVWQLAVPAAKELAADDPIAVNRMLSQLARETLRRRPAKYLQWLAWNANHARQQLLPLVVFDRGSVLLLIVLFGCLLRSLFRGTTCDRAATSDAMQNDPGSAHDKRHLERHVLLWMACGFVAAKTLLVILVEPAIGRYLTAAGVLFPAVIAVCVAHFVEACRPAKAFR